VLPSALTVAAIIAALETTSLGLMLGLTDSRAAQSLRGSRHFKTLGKCFTESLWSVSLFMFVAVSTMVLRCYDVHVRHDGTIVPATLLFFLLWAFLAGYRVFDLMIVLLFHKDGQGHRLPEAESTSETTSPPDTTG